MQQLLTNKKRKLEEEVPEKMERRFKEITIRLVKPPGGGKLGATVSFDTSNGTYLEIDTIDGGIMYTQTKKSKPATRYCPLMAILATQTSSQRLSKRTPSSTWWCKCKSQRKPR